MIDYQQLLQLLLDNCNQKYNQFNSKIVNSDVRAIGCTVPFLRKVAKQYVGMLDEMVALPTHDYYEVDLLKGIVVSTCKLPFDLKKNYLLNFAHTLENWAVCDCNTIKVKKHEMQQYFQFFCNLCLSSQPFVCRYGIVNLLANFLDDAHIDEVFIILRKVSVFGNYYVDMSVAWLIATAMVNCRSQTVAFIEGDARTFLNTFTYNKALQKMTESRRVTDVDKQWARSLKIKS